MVDKGSDMTRGGGSVPDSPITTWRDLMLRMQQLGRQHQCAVMTVTIVVEHGEPAHWQEPEVTSIEPSRLAHAFVARLKREVEP